MMEMTSPGSRLRRQVPGRPYLVIVNKPISNPHQGYQRKVNLAHHPSFNLFVP
jgi:hypothetical protein